MAFFVSVVEHQDNEERCFLDLLALRLLCDKGGRYCRSRFYSIGLRFCRRDSMTSARLARYRFRGMRIPAAERVKLACKRQGEEYCPLGKILDAHHFGWRFCFETVLIFGSIHRIIFRFVNKR